MTDVAYPEDFYGFPEVPLHIHLGMRFLRPDPAGPAVVVLPALPEIVEPDGALSAAAVFTAGEVAAGIAICDALLLHAAEAETAMIPLVLTRRTHFAPGPSRATGEISSTTTVDDAEGAAAERLRRSRKTQVVAHAELRTAAGDVVGRSSVDFYVRLMDRGRLEAMAGALTPRLAQGAAGTGP